MALKGDRLIVTTDIANFMNETATRGGVVCQSTVGSGAALDQAQQLVTYSANPSGSRPVGLLLEDMVNYDLTKQHANVHRDEMQIGGKVALLTDGWVVTNMIIGSPAKSDTAVLDNSGNLGVVTWANTPTHNTINKPVVGTWMSAKDEDGYAKVKINL
jgi:hypothetical protein